MVLGQVRRLFIVMDAQNRAQRMLESGTEQADEASEAMERTALSTAQLTAVFEKLALATIALTVAMVALVQIFRDIERQFALINATMARTQEKMDATRKAITKVAKQMPATLSQTAKAMKEFGFAGFTAKEGVEALRSVVKLSVTSQLNMREATRIVTAGVRAFNLEASQAVAVASTLGTTFKNSNTTIRELGNAFQYVTASASQAGLAVSELGAAVGVLASKGIRGSRAGTALNALLSRLARNAGRAQEALETLGLTTQDLTDQSGDFKKMGTIIRILAQRMQGLGDQEQLKIAQNLAGRRGGRALIPLIQSTKQYTELLRKNMRGQVASAVVALDNLTEAQEEAMRSSKIFKETLGKEADIDTGSTVGFLKSLREQMRKTKGVTEQEWVTLFATQFRMDTRAAQTLFNTLKNGNKDLKKVAKNMDKTVTTSTIMEKMMGTLNTQFNQVASSLQVLLLPMFEGLSDVLSIILPILKTLINFLARFEILWYAVGTAMVPVTVLLAIMTVRMGFNIAMRRLNIASIKSLITSQLINASTKKTIIQLGKGQITVQQAIAQMNTAESISNWNVVASTKAVGASMWKRITALYTVIVGIFKYIAAQVLSLFVTEQQIQLQKKSAAMSVMTSQKHELTTTALIKQNIVKAYSNVVSRIRNSIRKVSIFLIGAENTATVANTIARMREITVKGVDIVVTNLLTLSTWGLIVSLTVLTGGLFLVIGALGGLAAIGIQSSDVMAFLGNIFEWVKVKVGQAADLIARFSQVLLYMIPGIGQIFMLIDAFKWLWEILNKFFSPEAWLRKGRAIIDSLVTGIVEGIPFVEEALGLIDDFLPSSDARRGPLSTLTQSGRAFMNTFKEGAKSVPVNDIFDPLQRGLNDVLNTSRVNNLLALPGKLKGSMGSLENAVERGTYRALKRSQPFSMKRRPRGTQSQRGSEKPMRGSKRRGEPTVEMNYDFTFKGDVTDRERLKQEIMDAVEDAMTDMDIIEALGLAMEQPKKVEGRK